MPKVRSIHHPTNAYKRPEIWDAKKGCYRRKYWRELTEEEEFAEVEAELEQNRKLRRELHYK